MLKNGFRCLKWRSGSSRPAREPAAFIRWIRPTSSPRHFRSTLSNRPPTIVRSLSHLLLRLDRPILPTSSLARTVSTKPLPVRGPVFHFCYRLFAYAGFFALVSGGLVVAFFIYDATTYNENPVVTEVPVSQTALNPRVGGPKNLPIVDALIDDDDDEHAACGRDKPRLVVLGSGWGSVALLKTINPDDYHVVVVSPVNYFCFTPMLPSATVGTLELRSLMEPLRRIANRVRGHVLKASAVDVEFSEQLVELSQTDAKGVTRNFYLPYDKLVIGVG